MTSGVSGTSSYNYLGRVRQAQNGIGMASKLFGKIDANGDKSISKDEWSAFQTGLQSSGSTSALSLLNLLQNSTQLGTTGTSGSSGNSFTSIDTNRDEAISKDELYTALFGTRQKTGETSSSTSSQGATNKTGTLFNNIDTNGDGSLSKDELSAFQSTMTAQFLNGLTGSNPDASVSSTSTVNSAASLIHQALAKYMQFTPAGLGITTAGSLLGVG
jgi:Ca2+-binding EF-hand superfamily protein